MMKAEDARRIANDRPSKYELMALQWVGAIDATVRTEARNGGHSIMIPIHPVPEVTKLAMEHLKKNGFHVDLKKPNVQINWSK